MKNKNMHNIKTIISVFIFTVLGLGTLAFAQGTDEPVIKTSQTPFGQSVVVTFPQNYSGEVSSVFDGSQWKTTTKKYTQSDIDAMNKKVQEQQKAIQKIFEDQQKLFQQIWGLSWPFSWFY